MRLVLQRKGPTHADALSAAWLEAKRGLLAIAGWGACATDRKTAETALTASSAAYEGGVRRAVD